jgi:diphthamide synthase (EF-2-diphthine--ammonia ligase)
LDLSNRFIELGFKSIITCVDSKILDPKFVGRDFDKRLLSELPSSVDPIGENGEFHSFVYEGPIFKEKISFKIGKIVLRNERFYYVDLLPW